MIVPAVQGTTARKRNAGRRPFATTTVGTHYDLEVDGNHSKYRKCSCNIKAKNPVAAQNNLNKQDNG